MMQKPEPKDYGHSYDESSKLDQLAMELERKLSEVIYDRSSIDSRMVEDLRNYHGEYDDDTKALLKKAKRAHPFIKLTRAKTNAAESQLVDLLFPNDDKNWGIKPTPVPELAKDLQDDSPAVINGQEYQDEENKVITKADLAKRELEIVEERCDAMREEIDDQLVEASYNTKARQCIHDACVIGTGIIKGPVVVGKLDKVYHKGEQGWALELKESFTPSVETVRPWDFFPDMSASKITEAEFVFERRYLSRQQVRDLTKRRGFPKDQINRVLQMTAQQTQHTSVYQDDVRQLAGLSDTINDTRYETWEYHGPISNAVLVQLGVIKTDEDKAPDDEFLSDDTIATVFYCGGIVLGARLHMMSYEGYLPYRVYNWEPDDSCIFGFGVPRMCRDEQSIINSVWRTMLDNASITAGPQIGRNKKHIKPANGDWTIEPFKQWDIVGGVQDIKQVFSTFEFNSHLNELSAIYQTARVLFDEVTGVPMLQQGEQGQASQTMGGMSMLMNAANTVRRRQVKAWDDDITRPLISDFYHWNMTHNDKDDLKGDYQVDARGTGALLVRETQAFALTNFLQMASSSEVFAPVLQLKSADILRMWAKTQQLPKEIMPTDEELEAYQKQVQEQQKGQVQDPQIHVEQLRLQQQEQKFAHERQMFEQKTQLESAQVQAGNALKAQQIEADLRSAQSKERIELMKLAQNDKINTEKLLVELEKSRTKNDQDYKKFLAEIQVKQQMGKTGNYGLDG